MSRVVVIGSGANELAAAHLIARGRHEVTVLGEALAADDGMEAGWVPPFLVRALDLERHGLRIDQPDPWAIAVLPDGERLELGRDIAATAQAIAKLSPRDAAKWSSYCERMHTLATLLESLYTAPPPDPLASSAGGMLELLRTGLRVRGLGRRGMEDFFRLLPMSAADWLDEWFECDALKGVLGAAGVMHLAQGPRSGGTAFNLLHHHVGAAPGVFRPPFSNLRSALVRRPGVPARSGAVSRIDVREGRVSGVVLEDGETLPCDAVVSGLAPSRTLLELVDPGWLDPQLVRAVRNIRSRGVVAKLALTLDREPRFTTLVVAPSLDYLERAYDDVKYGRISSAPYIEACHAGTAGKDRHRVQVHVQYVPHALKDAVSDTALAEKLARSVVERISERVAGFARGVIEQHVLTPGDLDHVLGFPEGQAYQAELALDQILWMRPVPELARYRTPIRGLYLCGPAMHPGGGIAGGAGANAAAVILHDLKS